jgi:hypothetical protein
MKPDLMSRKDPQEVFKWRRMRMLEVEEGEVRLGAVTETESLADIARSAAPWKALRQETPRVVPERQLPPSPSEPPKQQAAPSRNRITGIFFLVLLLMSFAGLGTFLLIHRAPAGSSETARSIAAILEVFVTAALIALHLKK